MIPDFQLLEAAARGDLQAAREAVGRGANVHACDLHGHNSSYLACTRGHMPLAALLEEQGADVNFIYGSRKQTLLHWAAENGSFGVTKFLLAHNADINALRRDNSTPLHLAAKNGHTYVAQLLIDRGVILSARTSSRKTARDLAARAAQSHILALLDKTECQRSLFPMADETDSSQRRYDEPDCSL